MLENIDRSWIEKKLDIGRQILYLTLEDVKKVGLVETEVLDLTRLALLAHGEKNYEMPAKIGVHPYEDVFYHAMPAYVPAREAVGVKWVECYPSNPGRFNLPQTTGLLILNDVESGCPLAVMDATWVTAMRTPAVTVLAAGALHPGAETFAMFGCGVQGVEHCRYIVHTLPGLKRIYVYDIKEEAVENLVRIVQPQVDVEIMHGGSPESTAKSAEVLSSATVILQQQLAVVKDEWISAGQTILPCDLNTFWDPLTQRRSDKYIVDSADEHRLFAGAGYFPEGLPEIYGETGEVLAGVLPGREKVDEMIVCSNIGMAVCDVVVGKEVFRRALDKKIGQILPL